MLIHFSGKVFLSFMFTQVGVIVLICLYMVAGAFIFQHIEQDSLLEHALEAEQVIAVLDIIHLSMLFPVW